MTIQPSDVDAGAHDPTSDRPSHRKTMGRNQDQDQSTINYNEYPPGDFTYANYSHEIPLPQDSPRSVAQKNTNDTIPVSSGSEESEIETRSSS